MPQVKVVATGSSSLDLANRTNEPLTGRKRQYTLFPLSFAEMVNDHGLLAELNLIPHRLIYGYYPDIVNFPGEERRLLQELSDSYLYKDILALDKIKKSEQLTRLLRPIDLRDDVGKLWENFLVSERFKRNQYAESHANPWFWRTQAQQEIDYIEEQDGHLSAYEFKWNPSAKTKQPKVFQAAYPDSSFNVIHRDNFSGFLLHQGACV